jgi:hypothetical protein
MVVTVTAMRSVEMAGDEVVDVIAVRNALVTAIRSMTMGCVMAGCGMPRRALRRVRSSDLERMLLDHVATRRMVEMSIMEVIDMIVVAHRLVAARWPVDVAGIWMSLCFHLRLLG